MFEVKIPAMLATIITARKIPMNFGFRKNGCFFRLMQDYFRFYFINIVILGQYIKNK